MKNKSTLFLLMSRLTLTITLNGEHEMMLGQMAKDPRFFLNIFETMREGMMVIDEEGKILYFNKAAEDISGYPRAEVLGQSCVMLDSDTCVVLTSEGKQKKCDLFKAGQICNKRCRIRAKDGKSVYLLKNAVVLRDEGGEIIGAVETMTDVTTSLHEGTRARGTERGTPTGVPVHGASSGPRLPAIPE